MLVGFPAGGGADMAARIVAQKLTPALGQQVVIDNRAGANGAIAAELAVRASPDGHTLMMLAIAQAIGSAHETKLSYDLLRDFDTVSQVIRQPYLVVSTLSLPVRNIADVIALAKARPGQLTYASTGMGGSNHLATEIFSAATGARMLHVPYKGSSPALADLVGGQVQLMFSSIITGLPLARGGKLRALAVSSRQRLATLSDVPTVADTVPGFEAIGWYGVVAPRGTRREVVTQLHAAIAQGMQAQDVKTRLAGEGSEAVSTAPAEFAVFLREELQRFARVIKAAGIRP
jgi:tripartite-type tricarboxylate transporter receptor subunit TctC